MWPRRSWRRHHMDSDNQHAPGSGSGQSNVAGGATIGRGPTLRASAASGGASGAGSGPTRRLSVSACILNQKKNNNKAMKRL